MLLGRARGRERAQGHHVDLLIRDAAHDDPTNGATTVGSSVGRGAYPHDGLG